jgi:hypothetical protein
MAAAFAPAVSVTRVRSRGVPAAATFAALIAASIFAAPSSAETIKTFGATFDSAAASTLEANIYRPQLTDFEVRCAAFGSPQPLVCGDPLETSSEFLKIVGAESESGLSPLDSGGISQCGAAVNIPAMQPGILAVRPHVAYLLVRTLATWTTAPAASVHVPTVGPLDDWQATLDVPKTRGASATDDALLTSFAVSRNLLN